MVKLVHFCDLCKKEIMTGEGHNITIKDITVDICQDCYSALKKVIDNENICASLRPVGGKIFYIDPADNGAEYTFYDINKKKIDNITVGDSPYYYYVKGVPIKDKFYVFNADIIKNKTWAHLENGDYVYERLYATDEIGKGKINTDIVMSVNYDDYTKDMNTIWNSLNSLNMKEDKGCNDWFVPSNAELEQLRLATDKDGNPLTTLFSNTYIWSSSEYSAGDAWLWYYGSQVWGYNNKSNNLALLAARAF